MKKGLFIAAVLSSTLLLQGCLAVALGTGAVVTAKAVSDPRTVGTQVDDTTLASRVGMALKDNSAEFENARVVSSVYNGSVLLTGQVQTVEQAAKAARIVLDIDGVLKVYNQLRVAPRISAGTLSNDTWITAKVKTQLIANSQTKARNIKVVTENREVFLMGILTHQEGLLATEVASKVAGVKLVVTAFEYLD